MSSTIGPPAPLPDFRQPPSSEEKIPNSKQKQELTIEFNQAGLGYSMIRVPALFFSLIHLALKRLRYHPGLTLLALLSVILAVGLVTSAAFFSQAVDQVIMSQILAEYTRITKRPPFSTRVSTYASRQVPLSLERAELLGQNVAGTLATEVGLPVKYQGLQIDSGVTTLQAKSENSRRDSSAKVHLIYIEGVQGYMDLLEGEPLAEDASSSILEVWAYSDLAEKMGLQIGDEFELVANNDRPPLSFQIKGIWQATDTTDPFWFSDPDKVLTDKLLVRRQDYLNYVEPWLPVRVRTATWHITLDESKVIPAQGRRYVSGFERADIVISKYLPDARLVAPSLSLEQFVERQTTLTTLLLGFNVPAFGFLLYFLILTSAIIAYWQRREVAMLKSRGMKPSSIVIFTLIEELILFIIGCPLGLGFGILLAWMMGYTDGFLSFTERAALPVSVRGINLPLTIVTLGVVLVARLWPTAQAARQTIIEQEREHARPSQGPFWYRHYLDLLLIFPVWYAYDQLSQRGTLAVLVRDRPEDLYQDPLLILVPALFILAAALLAMRIFPLLMRLLDIVAPLLAWLTPHLALRQLGRQHHNYINPLLLVIVSLALGVYTLSMAASLDQWLIDRLYYRVGTDLTFEPYLESQILSETVGAMWVPPPGEFGGLPGIEAATRVGEYPAEISLASRSSNRMKARFLAIDRIDFASVAWFRDDFAAEHLNGLMNRLAAEPNGLVVSRAFLRNNTLQIGDTIQVEVIADIGAAVKSPFVIVGAYQYFPTVYDDEVTVIGNMEYLISFFGIPMPHRIWLRTQAGVDGSDILQAVESTGIDTILVEDAAALIVDAQAQMERVGVFGTLSISFLAATIMAAMGLLIYSYASLQERLFYFAVLRAMGLRRGQVIGQVAMEYIILTAYGVVAGVIIGAIATQLFVPLFRITGEGGTPLPPLLPVIAQEQIIPLAVIFAGIMIVLEVIVIAVALYRRLIRALRLGYQG